jgi:hypothetical protein
MEFVVNGATPFTAAAGAVLDDEPAARSPVGGITPGLFGRDRHQLFLLGWKEDAAYSSPSWREQRVSTRIVKRAVLAFPKVIFLEAILRLEVILRVVAFVSKRDLLAGPVLRIKRQVWIFRFGEISTEPRIPLSRRESLPVPQPGVSPHAAGPATAVANQLWC